jgi:NAD(P)-dependent dehydrogenase (short-subunit alcohol dehydrogenase family)
VTGGDSGIGRAVALAYAREGAHVIIPYFNEHKDAEVSGSDQFGKTQWHFLLFFSHVLMPNCSLENKCGDSCGKEQGSWIKLT